MIGYYITLFSAEIEWQLYMTCEWDKTNKYMDLKATRTNQHKLKIIKEWACNIGEINT